MKHMKWLFLGLLLVTLMTWGAATPVQAQGPAIEWELVNPAGSFKIVPMELAPRPSSLEGKTVGLRWNSKPGGDFYLDRVAELLTQQVKNVKIIKLYEVAPETRSLNGAELAKKVASFKPDLVISSQGD